MIVFRNLNPIEVNEGDGQITLEIDPTASGITEETVVEISTINGSARSTPFNTDGTDVDFNPITTLTTNLDPNNPDSLTFTIDIIDDAIAEVDEEFQFQVIARDNASLNRTATISILDDDRSIDEQLPGISITDVEMLEGDTGTNNFEFTVSLSQASIETVTVDYATADGTGEAEDRIANGSVVDLADYISTTGTLEFSPGETSKTITVEVLTDVENLSTENPDETFFVNLANAANANLDQFVGTGTILDDDQDDVNNDELPFLELNTATVLEGNLGENTTQDLTVNLVDSNGEPLIATTDITFAYSTLDVTAAADVDYQFTSQSATIPQGQSNISIPVTVIGDNQVEPDETFSVVLSEIDSELVQFGNGESELATEITIEDDDGDINQPDPDPNDILGNDIFRFYDPTTGVHFYTASETERDFVEANLNNYELENPSYASVNPDNAEGEAEVYRFFNSTTGGHFYTTDENERDFIIDNSDDFIFEDVAFYAFETNVDNTIPVYRFFESTTGVHFYTADEAERTFVEANLSNYNFEGIAYYALPIESNV